MSKLGDEVRASYERQQARLGDLGDARHRLIQNAVTTPARESHRLQWAAAIAAVLIAAIVITTFALVRTSFLPNPIPDSTPKPTPLLNALNVPDSTPLLLYHDPANPDQLDGVTWDGTTSGKLANQQLKGVGNPQNNLFATTDSISDRSGSTVMTGSFGAKYFANTWADDGRHLCQIVPLDNPGGTGLPTTLQLVTVGGGTRKVAQVGTLYNQTFVSVAACSVLADRAVVVQSGGQGIGIAAVWVVELSTGAIVWTHVYDVSLTSVTVVASRDGRYVAASDTNGLTTISGPNGSVAGTLPVSVFGFSWDGTLAVTALSFGAAPSIVRWSDGKTLWTCRVCDPMPPGDYWKAFPEPNGTRIAIGILDPAYLIVVDAAGAVVFEKKGVTLLQDLH